MNPYVVIAVIVACIAVAGALVVAVVTLRRSKGPESRRPASTSQPAAASDDRNSDGHDRASAATRLESQAERADQLRNLLLSRMSHDIRTPLNSVITLSQLLTEGSAGGLTLEQRKYVDVIQRSGQTLLGLLNDILDLANLEAGRLEVESASVDLRALAGGAAEACTPAAQRKGLPLHLNLPRRAVIARGDEERLRHVLVALVQHAVSETRNGYVEISVDASEHHALLRVADTGGGLSPGVQRALYDDFLAGVDPFAGRSAPPLPLVVAGRLIRLMGGSITVESVGGEGATFTIAMPLVAESPAHAVEPDARLPAVAPGTVSGHVLLIEDDDIERRRVAAQLETAGYDVGIASSGEEGLALLRAGRYDAVVLDLVMPGMSGLDVLRRARVEESLAGVPFVVLSALYMTKSEREVLGPGVAAVVRKGDASGDELAQQLRRAIKEAPAAAAEQRPFAAGGQRARVLVVEDNLDNLFTIEQVLASLPVTIETAGSGPEAVEICRQHPPDLVMMDVELPGMSGLEASRAIHALPDCERIPIIALTAEAMQGDRERVLAAQISDYLPKPIQPTDVVSAVSRALHLQPH